jgi:hypothetical protein
MDVNPQNISPLVMALHLLDNKLENKVLPSVSCNNYKSNTLYICIMKYHSVFMLKMLFLLTHSLHGAGYYLKS